MRQVQWRSLEFDLFAVMTSSVATGGLGFLFWTLAARGFNTAEVGRASAIISAATMLATLAMLSLGSMYERFLPLAGREARRLVSGGLVLTTTLAALLGAGFLLLGPRERLFDSWSEAAWFPLWVIILAAFGLLDPILIGLHRARQVAVKNVTQSVAKLVLLAAFVIASTAGSTIVAAWVLPAALVAAIVAARVIRPQLSTLVGPHNLPPRRDLLSFFLGTYAMTLVGVLVPLTVPLIIVAQLGAESNAYFNMSWLLVSTIAILIGTSSAPYIATAAADPSSIRDSTTRFVRICVGAGVAGCALLLGAGPLILRIFGTDYAEEASTLVRLMALTLPFVSLMTVYSALARLHRTLRLAAAVQWLTAAAIIGGISATTAMWGLNAVGIVYLTVEIGAALVIAFPLARFLRAIYGSDLTTTITHPGAHESSTGGRDSR